MAVPLLLASVYLPGWLTSLAMLASVYLIYRLMEPLQGTLFDLSRPEIQWFVTVPCYCFFLCWGALVVISGRHEQIGRTVGSVFLLVLVSIWPLFRRAKNFAVTERKVPFGNVYAVFAVLVLVQQCFILWRYVCNG